jgi:hypothetical protein
LASSDPSKMSRVQIFLLLAFQTAVLIHAKSDGNDADWIKHTVKGHDSWHRTSYPLEEWTTGEELGPDDMEWGHEFTVNFKTSRREFAETSGPVFITFYGHRATSDTMLLAQGANQFRAGSTTTVLLKLSREIGTLKKVKLQTNSTDGWLLSSMWINSGSVTFMLATTSRFLDYPDSALPDLRWDGGSDGTEFTSDPVGVLQETFEPQAPRALNTEEKSSMEGLIGSESLVLDVVDTTRTFLGW